LPDTVDRLRGEWRESLSYYAELEALFSLAPEWGSWLPTRQFGRLVRGGSGLGLRYSGGIPEPIAARHNVSFSPYNLTEPHSYSLAISKCRYGNQITEGIKQQPFIICLFAPHFLKVFRSSRKDALTDTVVICVFVCFQKNMSEYCPIPRQWILGSALQTYIAHRGQKLVFI